MEGFAYIQEMDALDLTGILSAKQLQALACTSPSAAKGQAVAKDIDDVFIKHQSNGRFEFTLTTGRVDRDNDTIAMDGWRIENFLKNPVWLWSHDSSIPEIGVVTAIELKPKHMPVEVQFLESNPLGVMVRQILEERSSIKALKDKGGAVSVGALPLELEYNHARGGIDYLVHDLLEGSSTPIGSNPETLRRAIAAGIDVSPAAEWAEKWRTTARKTAAMSTEVVTVNLKLAQAIAEEIDPGRGLRVFELSPDAFVKRNDRDQISLLTDAVAKNADAIAALAERQAQAPAQDQSSPTPEHNDQPATKADAIDAFRKQAFEVTSGQYTALTGKVLPPMVSAEDAA